MVIKMQHCQIINGAIPAPVNGLSVGGQSLKIHFMIEKSGKNANVRLFLIFGQI